MKRNEEPLVSIVLPVYNGETYMRISIDSCIRQTYQNWELLIVDDGSTDGSAQIAKEYEAKDPRIHYHKNPRNLKLPRTLNRGFSLAKGEYLTWTSDDNFYRPAAIEKMVRALQESDAEFVFAKCSIIDADGKELSVLEAPAEYRHAIWDYDFVGACFLYSQKVYETIGEYDPELFLCEDYDYWLRIFAQYQVQYLDENLYSWRRHPGGLSATHRQGQYTSKEQTLLKNFAKKADAVTLDRFYLYRGLHGSRSLRPSLTERYRYFPKLLCYKLWHKTIYRLRGSKQD